MPVLCRCCARCQSNPLTWVSFGICLFDHFLAHASHFFSLFVFRLFPPLTAITLSPSLWATPILLPPPVIFSGMLVSPLNAGVSGVTLFSYGAHSGMELHFACLHCLTLHLTVISLSSQVYRQHNILRPRALKHLFNRCELFLVVSAAVNKYTRQLVIISNEFNI